MHDVINVRTLAGSVIYSLVGGAILCLGFALMDRLSPYHLWKEIVLKKNVALAILAGSMALGLSLIIAASIHG